jgi:hypothetical protein
MQQISLTLFAAVGIGLAVLFFGYFFGLFEGRSRGYSKRKKEDEQEKRSTPPPPPPAPRAPDENSLLKLGLDPGNQPLLQLDGKRVDTAQLTSEQRARLIDLMLTMRPWVQPGTDAKPTSVAQTAPRAYSAQTPSLTASAPGPTPAPTATAPLAPAAAQKKDEAAPTTMVAQIDTILQKSLIGTPLATMGIRLVESPQHNATVEVGLNKYAGVGDVPDPQVKAAIKAAIAEWEKKYTPG